MISKIKSKLTLKTAVLFMIALLITNLLSFYILDYFSTNFFSQTLHYLMIRILILGSIMFCLSIMTRHRIKLTDLDLDIILYIYILFILVVSFKAIYPNSVNIDKVRLYTFNLLDIYKYGFNSRTDFLLLIGNILFYIPFGYLVKYRFKKLKKASIMMLALIFVLSIELSQYIFYLGVFDVGDIVLNLIGVYIGATAYKSIA